MAERFGFLSQKRFATYGNRPLVWLHAVSVGETRAAIPLIRAIKKENPEAVLVISNVTETGHRTARSIPEIDECIYFPFDFTPVMQRVLDILNPSLILIVETEIWPNLVRLAHVRRIPISLVNGRISDRSFPRYHRVRFLLGVTLRRFNHLCMQSSRDARRIQHLGARAEDIHPTGNIKFDYQQPLPSAQEIRQWRETYRLPEDCPIWCVGSTHDKEEEQIARIFRRLQMADQKVILVLAPRHPERKQAVAGVLKQYGFPFRFRSELTENTPPLKAGEVLLVDTMGEMIRLYACSDIVFVGGSMVPIGGHNILEAALVGKPVLWGPNMQNFKDISRKVLLAGGGLQVKTLEELFDLLKIFLNDSKQCELFGTKGRALLESNSGATEETMKILRPYLENR